MSKKCDELVQIIVELLDLGSHDHVIQACSELVKKYPRELRFWSLMGCSLGNQGRHDEASKCFTNALAISGFQCGLMTNLISSTFGRGEPLLACRMIDRYFYRLCRECQHNNLINIIEALRIGDVDRPNLPKNISRLLKNVEPI